MNLFKKFAETITAEFLEKPDTYMKFTKVLSGLWTSLILQRKETEKKKEIVVEFRIRVNIFIQS